MKRVVEAGRTMLVDGPASVTLLSGDVEVLGAKLKNGSKLVIRESKRVPFYAVTKAEYDVLAGEKGAANDVEGNTIPRSWENAAQKALSIENKPAVIMIVGAIDVGKTSFCTYLANMALKAKRSVAMIDADLGQSDLGPPSTIGLSHISKPIRDPFEIGTDDIRFIGVTSPSSALSEAIDGVGGIVDKAKSNCDFLIVNTDGWVEGEDAVRYKLALAKRVRPNMLIGIQEQSELTFLLGALAEFQSVSIESSPAVRKRDREERKTLRELGYKKYLKGAAVQSLLLSWFKVSGVPFGLGSPPSRSRLDKIVEQIGTTPLYCEETSNTIFIALSREQWADEEIAKTLEGRFNKKVKIVWEGDEKGLLVALDDKVGNFLGIGIIEELDYKRQALKVYTNIKKDIASIHVGQVRLDKSGKEIEQNSAFADYS